MKKIRFLATLMSMLVITHLLASIASAHPLGNFTVNHYAGLHITEQTIAVDYVLDMAEIPTFQEIARFDADGDGQADPDEAARYRPEQCEFVRAGLVLRVNGRPAALAVTASEITFPPGAGGLPTLRLSCTLSAPLKGRSQNIQIAFENNVYAERLGWREIVVTVEGVSLPGDLSEMARSLSNRLTRYPDDLLTSPLNQRAVTFTLNATGAPEVNARPLGASVGEASGPKAGRNDRFTELITLPHLTPLSLLVALALAFVWGAAHALTLGHGKTIVAAHLVGSRGTMKHALFLGLRTAITHTAGVFVLGLLTLFASRFILPQRLYPWLGVLSGALVVWIGLSLFRGRETALDHAHDDPGDAGLYRQPGGGQATWRSLLALSVSDGLIPCPSALVVMLSAIALQRAGLGLMLIIAFSLGLAGVLAAMGVLWVQARRVRFFERIPGRGLILQALPAASALFITVIGVGITLQALLQTGVLS